MKYFLKVAYYNWTPGSQSEMLYEDEKGEYFIGPHYEVIIGRTCTVEVSSKFPEDTYYRIVQFIA